MGKKNKSYNKMFDETVAEPIEATELNPIEPVVEPAAEPVIEPTVEEAIKFATGVVVDCNSLNVRAIPDRKGDVVSILMHDDEVQVNVTDSYDEWYHVFTATGLDGFCMKKYIAVKE